ncbi:sugar transferase [Rhodococcus sp. NPDC058521]|uniref:sugar transferase n=1 Tax=Rhodococcus sp. NPDC058521 TaxID=3346536 RepID=UPI00364ED891
MVTELQPTRGATSKRRLAGRVRPVRSTEQPNSWRREYTNGLRVTDAVVVVGAVSVAHFVRFEALDGAESGALATLAISASIAVAWLAHLVIHRTRSPRVVGAGPEEYRRVVSSTVGLFGILAIALVLLRVDIARGYLAIALPLGLLGLLLTRRAWRKRLARLRRSGKCSTTVLVVGGRDAATSLGESFARDTSTGFRIVGVCVPGGEVPTGADSVSIVGAAVPVFGDERHVVDALAATGADTVAVTATEQLGHSGIRRLIWDIEPHDVDLVVAPGVVDVAGSRLAMRPVGDLPLLNVEKPQYHGAARFTKTAFDVVFASGALIATAPIAVAIAVAIKLTSPGPVFYRSERIGLDGKPFQILKFRTMVVDADAHLAALLEQNESDGGVLFKMRNDPRVTRVGRVLRRYSLDELPQFFNVLKRDMSVVGPRPPIQREVDEYQSHVRRRLLVKPGVTGLWQVSGRSDLSWEESVRLDLSYVENWSMIQDLLIVAKTVRAVTRSEGAY